MFFSSHAVLSGRVYGVCVVLQWRRDWTFGSLPLLCLKLASQPSPVSQATLGFEAVESGYLAAVMVPVGAKDVQVLRAMPQQNNQRACLLVIEPHCGVTRDCD